MDRLREATNSYYLPDGVTPAFEPTNAGLNSWKIAYMHSIGEPEDKVKSYSPMFVTARWDKQLLQKLDVIDQMLANGKLKSSSGVRKKTDANLTPDKFQSLGATYVTALNGLPDEMIMSHLMKVINREWTLKEMQASALNEKTKNRIISAWVKLTGAQNPQEVIKRFGKPVVDQSFTLFARLFNKDKSKPDKEFVTFVNAKLSQVKAREAIMERAERARIEAAGVVGVSEAEGALGSGDEGTDVLKETVINTITEEVDGRELTTGFSLQMNRVFLNSAEFRGSDEIPGDDLGFDLTSHTKISLFHGDVTANEQVLMTGKAKLVVIDPPYGVLNTEQWDVKWEKEHFRQCLKNVVAYNSADAFTLISFCSADQISGFLEVIREFDSPTLQVGYTHGAWYKVDHHHAGKCLSIFHVITPYSHAN
jgi:hypothetical protein